MALPKRRHSKTRQAKRRTHWKLSVPTVVDCPRCHAPRLPHHVCPSCGFYNGRLVLEVKEKEKKE
ncbi:MAG: 50S ribosomal protein L32 [Armatimonadota bacterium]|nr:50S ribosomal protein L32 [Armatimonadota bacterium]MDH7481338.1 50S ribosomal protein L32 [Armatimonadota bacterium]MDI6827117.1 50S ribosomal protein L32 [Armatimonadota bacterium]